MKQGMLLAVLALALVWNMAVASEATSSYSQAEGEYERVVSEYVQQGPCVTGKPKVLEAQRHLAKTVALLSSTAGQKVLLFAVTANSPDDVRRLLAAGAPRIGDNGSLLHSAALFGDAPLLEALTKAGFALEVQGEASGSPLFAAVQSNRADIVDWLVQHGADVNAVDTSGAPVLRHALMCSNTAIIERLLAAGARIDETTRAGAEAKGVGLK